MYVIEIKTVASFVIVNPGIVSISIDKLEIETIPGFTITNDATVFISMTYNGITHGQEDIEEYGMENDYGKRFIVRRLGYVRDWVSFRFRGASRSRMAFGKGTIDHD